MDIYKFLKDEETNLSFDELQFLEDELLIGNYDVNYIKKCKEKIGMIKNKKKDKESKKYGVSYEDLQGLLIESSDLLESDEEDELSIDEKFINMVVKIRGTKEFEEKIMEIIKKLDIKEDFIDKNFSFFKKGEITYLCENISFSEYFLEKYINELDKNTISKFQYFSEDFFQKYYRFFNANIVLNNGVNEWRNKDKMSKKLEIFLKLKGVKL